MNLCLGLGPISKISYKYANIIKSEENKVSCSSGHVAIVLLLSGAMRCQRIISTAKVKARKIMSSFNTI